MHTLHTAAALVTARGDLDLATAPELRRSLSAALRTDREVVLDLAGVEFMDCAGLGALVHAQNQADRLGARLILRGAGSRVLRLLRLTGLNQRLIVEP